MADAFPAVVVFLWAGVLEEAPGDGRKKFLIFTHAKKCNRNKQKPSFFHRKTRKTRNGRRNLKTKGGHLHLAAAKKDLHSGGPGTMTTALLLRESKRYSSIKSIALGIYVRK